MASSIDQLGACEALALGRRVTLPWHTLGCLGAEGIVRFRFRLRLPRGQKLVGWLARQPPSQTIWEFGPLALPSGDEWC
jgi:hypothetical protein